MLFSKKNKKANKEAEEEVVKTEEGAEETKEPEVKAVPAAVFSQRMGGVFGKMYKMILSVSLANNVVQIESGEQTLFGKEVPVRMRYSDWCGLMLTNMNPEDQDKFKEDFAAVKLSKELSYGEGTFTGIYGVVENGDFEEGFKFWELRADCIPDASEVKTRCIIYIRETAKRPVKKLEAKEESAEERDWNDVRMTKLLGGESPIFFEYNAADDVMRLHHGADTEPKVIEHYLVNIENRSDWTIFHSDCGKVRDALNAAAKGVNVNAEIRYRAEGGTGTKFHIHKMSAAPVENEAPYKWVVGVLTDIDAEVKDKQSKIEIGEQISKILSDTYEGIFEIDLAKDRICKVIRTEDGGFAKDSNVRSFKEYIAKMISGESVKEEYKKVYKDFISKGFLDRKTLGGNYDVDVVLRLPGSLEYRWYQETIVRLEGENRYLRFLQDINDIQEARAKEHDMAENARYVEYNRQMLDTVASLVEFRSVESGPHIEHVRDLTRIILENLAETCPFYEITKNKISLYSEAATMHDIGKIVIPDMILNKEGKFTPEEWSVMKTHTTAGAKIIEKMKFPGQEELIECCKDVALHHHERFDGRGYPEGLVGDDISIGVQAVGLADVYDALVSERCYKDGLPHEEAVRMILDGECGAFNPKVLEVFKKVIPKMQALYGLG